MRPSLALSRAIALLLLPIASLAIGQYQCVYFSNSSSSFISLVSNGQATPIYTSDDEWPGVLRAANDFRNDIANVTGVMPYAETITTGSTLSSSSPSVVVLIGTLGHSSLIDQMVSYTGMDVSGLTGQWEAYTAHMMMNPLPSIDMAYVIMGSDKRGTIFGMYELSEQMGVSPWYWWADVPIKTNSELYVDTCAHGSPSVKYRAMFLNDEQPALQSWAQYYFTNGTTLPFNHYFYTHLFELILRMRANTLLLAMWSGMFGVDDILNQPLADYFGVVMTTSHEEPIMRSTPNEWNYYYPGQVWDFARNAANLTQYWTEGAMRGYQYEGVWTVGMRGAGDLPMGPTTNVALLESVMATQRQILASLFNTPNVSSIPQAWVTPFPPNSGNFTPGTGPSLEYDIYLFNTVGGNVTLYTYVSPSLNNDPSRPLGYAVQWDDQPAQSIYFIPYAPSSTMPAGWGGNDGYAVNTILENPTNITTTPGAHKLTVWMIEPAVVLQRVVVDTGNMRKSYVGPPESMRV